MLRPEPCARPSSGSRLSTKTGRWKRSTRRAATMPNTPRCQLSAANTSARCPSSTGTRALPLLDWHARALLHDLLRDFRLRLLALAIQRVQLLGQRTRALRIAGQEHLDHGVGRIHAPGGVNARRDA